MIVNYKECKKPYNGWLRRFKKINSKPWLFTEQEYDNIGKFTYDNPLLMDIDAKRFSWFIQYYSHILNVRCIWYNHILGYETVVVIGKSKNIKYFSAILTYFLTNAFYYHKYHYDKVKRYKRKSKRNNTDSPYKNTKPTQYASTKLDKTLDSIKNILLDKLDNRKQRYRNDLEDYILKNFKFFSSSEKISISKCYAPANKYRYKRIVNAKLHQNYFRIPKGSETHNDLGT